LPIRLVIWSYSLPFDRVQFLILSSISARTVIFLGLGVGDVHGWSQTCQLYGSGGFAIGRMAQAAAWNAFQARAASPSSLVGFLACSLKWGPHQHGSRRSLGPSCPYGKEHSVLWMSLGLIGRDRSPAILSFLYCLFPM
jgi:hypothetical protein